MDAPLCKISFEAFESIATRLKTRHFARLYMTGCRQLQQWIQAVRNRSIGEVTNVTCDTVESKLVSDVLVNSATHVDTDWIVVETLSVDDPSRSPSNIRTLILRDKERFGDFASTETMNSFMRTLPQLEALDLWMIHFPGVLVLPSTLTSVTFHDMFRHTGADNLQSLPSLLHLGISIDTTDTSTYDWMPNAKWHATLTSLTLDGDFREIGAVPSSLPPNLVRLELNGSGGRFRTDLGKVTGRLTSLQTLDVLMDWFVGSHLPSSLTCFNNGGLVTRPEIGLLGTLEFLPMSLTSLNRPNVRIYDESSGNYVVIAESDFTLFAERILPRLDLMSSIDVINRYYQYVTDGVPVGESKVERIMIEKLTRAGLGAGHLKWLHDWSGPVRSDPSDRSVSHFYQYGLTSRKDVAFFLDTRLIAGEWNCNCPDHYEGVIKCLEWNLRDTLTVTAAPVPVLTEPALRNLVRIQVWVIDVNKIKSVLGRHVFPSLRRLDCCGFPDEVPTAISHLAALIDIIHECRANLPAIQVIKFPHWPFWSIPLDDDSAGLLAGMRFRHVEKTCGFLYTTKLPLPILVDRNVEPF
jgi:hypothetical protein